LNPGRRVRLAIESMDFLTIELGCRYLETLTENTAEDAGTEDEELEGAEN
jgi:hypothetical protein